MDDTKLKQLIVGTPQGDAGRLVKESRYVFNYQTPEHSREVSLVMPYRAESYADTVLPSVFAMNRPEGYLLDKLRERFGKLIRLDDMRLLAITGANQIGRLRYVDPDAPHEAVRAEVGLSALLSAGASDELFEHLVSVYLSSGISGFQPKVMMPDADALTPLVEKSTAVTPDLIVKAAGDDYEHLAQNEFLCMSAAREAGIVVPEFWLSDDRSLFVMRRFDLEGPERHPLGFEDMAVLTGRAAEQKYLGSYEKIATMIGYLCAENKAQSLARFFEYVTLSVMVRNGDAHLKNFGLIYDHPGGRAPTLAPLFDVVTTTVYSHYDPQSGRTLTDRTLALKLGKSRDYPNRRVLMEFGRTACGVARPERVIERIASAMFATLEQHKARIDPSFLTAMRAQWEQGCAAVRDTKLFAAKS
ncbi:type II toxin-antitoxin system HipA family toxin [Pandoraea sp. PE-S2T-3]|uniref:type II toxin-antitoxin system HipA family toxin n=1 Tax=Pandoraea sp. PE-S2T-3 TaxID=1986993 RepID=UPI000B3F9241|nr:type II toxin-antitoxin system HipA family toxin [Pandoraea sp. PE-S2T-3]